MGTGARSCLLTLGRYDQVCFVAVSAMDAKEGSTPLDPDDLPILIAYQGGEFKSSAKQVGKKEGTLLTEAHVELVVRRMEVRLTSSKGHSVGAASTAPMCAADMVTLKTLGLGGESEDEDED